jgi:hypothetical protein
VTTLLKDGTPYAGDVVDLGAGLTVGQNADGQTTLDASGSGGGGGTVVAARVHRTAALSPANDVVTAVPFDAEDYDATGMHDPTTNPDRLTVATAGVYRVVGGVHFTADVNGSRSCYIEATIGGVATRVAGASVSAISSTRPVHLSVAAEVTLGVGDFLRLLVRQDAGGALALVVGGDVPPSLAASLVASTAGSGGGSGDATSIRGVTVDTPTTNATVATYNTTSGHIEWQPPASTAAPHPDDPPAVADAMDDEFVAGPLNARWAWRNQGTAAAVFAYDRVSITAPTNAGDSWRIIEQVLPAGTGRYRAKLAGISEKWDQNYWGTGLVLVESGTGKLIRFGPDYSGSVRIGVQRWNSVTSFSVDSFSRGNLEPIDLRELHYEVEFTATQIIFRLSASGILYTEWYRENKNAFFTTAPDRIGIGVNTNNATWRATIAADYFRRVA